MPHRTSSAPDSPAEGGREPLRDGSETARPQYTAFDACRFRSSRPRSVVERGSVRGSRYVLVVPFHTRTRAPALPLRYDPRPLRQTAADGGALVDHGLRKETPLAVSGLRWFRTGRRSTWKSQHIRPASLRLSERVHGRAGGLYAIRLLGGRAVLRNADGQSLLLARRCWAGWM